MNSIRTVALTGATGFIGINLLNIFVRQGLKIRALYRSESPGSRPDLPGISWVKGSVKDVDALRKLVSGADAVVHCAGVVKALDPRDFFTVNTLGTRAVLEAMEAVCQEPRLLFISSLAARHPSISPYAESKYKAEELIKRWGCGSWTIIRPPAVYGPGDKEIVPIFKAMQKGLALVPGSGSNRFSLIHVFDLAEAVLEVVRDGHKSAKILEIHDGTPGGYSWMDVIHTCQTVFGRKILTVTVPGPVLKLVGLGGLVTSRLRSRPVMLTPWKVSELLHPDWVCANNVQEHGLSWMPRLTLKLALENGLVG